MMILHLYLDQDLNVLHAPQFILQFLTDVSPYCLIGRI